MPTLPCPCGQPHPYDHCCGRLHQGAVADTPEQLMRARYSAFALGHEAFLLRSWARATRPPTLSPIPQQAFLQLQVLDAPPPRDGEGQVRFRALSREGRQWLWLEETSRFHHEDGDWRYVDGNARWLTLRPGRNDPCPCGSGRKLKQCHGRDQGPTSIPPGTVP